MINVEGIFSNSIDELNATFPESKIRHTDDFCLLGRESSLDSLALVSFVIAVEKFTEKEFNVKVSIVSEDSFSMEQSPLSTVGSLKQYLRALIEEQK